MQTRKMYVMVRKAPEMHSREVGLMLSAGKIEIMAIVYEKNKLKEPVTGVEISKIRNVLTTSTYDLIYKLEGMGLIEKKLVGRTKYLSVPDNATKRKVAEACWIITKFNNNGKELTLQKAP